VVSCFSFVGRDLRKVDVHRGRFKTHLILRTRLSDMTAMHWLIESCGVQIQSPLSRCWFESVSGSFLVSTRSIAWRLRDCRARAGQYRGLLSGGGPSPAPCALTSAEHMHIHVV
jgi:hypothetical protein